MKDVWRTSDGVLFFSFFNRWSSQTGPLDSSDAQSTDSAENPCVKRKIVPQVCRLKFSWTNIHPFNGHSCCVGWSDVGDKLHQAANKRELLAFRLSSSKSMSIKRRNQTVELVFKRIKIDEPFFMRKKRKKMK